MPACRNGRDDLSGSVLARPGERAEPARGAVRGDAEPVEGLGARREGGHLGALTAVEVADRQPVVRGELDRGRRAAPHAVPLAGRIERYEAGDE